MSLLIRPLEAKINKDTDKFGKMDPYVVCIAGMDKKTTDKSKGTNPKWDETFHFNGTPEYVEVELWDKDRLRSDDFVGRTRINLSALYQSGKKSQNYEVTLQQKGEEVAQLRIYIQFEGGNGMKYYQGSGWGPH